MATAALVNNDIDIGRRIVAALTRAAIPVSVYLWAFIPQLQEWQFIIASSLVDAKGPLAAYAEVNKALQKAGVFDEAPLRRIFLRSPNDRILKSLERDSRSIPQESFKVVNAEIAGNFVEDAYVYSGSIHIVQLGISKGPAPRYSLIYTPYSGTGGAAPSLQIDGIENVRQFLVKKLRIFSSVVESALEELTTKGSTSIPNVQLNHSELRRLGLA